MNLPVFSTIRQVIVNPRQFYTGMPQEGGVIQPSLFVVAVALLSAVLLALLELFTQGLGSALSVLLQSIVVLPVYSLLACLLLTIGFQLLWKILQTPQGFEVAFRCVAYSFAVFPLWVLLKEQHILPQVLLLVLWAVILSAATETVHAVNTMKSRVVFVVLVVLAWAFMLCNCGDNNADQASVMVKAETTAEELSVVVVESSDTSIGGLELAVEKNQGAVVEPGIVVGPVVGTTETPVALDQKSAALTGDTGLLEESSDAEELFTLSPEQAGQKFGELVKGVSEAVMSVGDDFQRGLDNVQRQDAQPEEQPGVEESSGQTDLPVSENPGEDQPEVPNKEQSLSPQQLGEMLGVFIRDMNAALKDAEQGFEAGMQSEAPGNTEATAAAEKAGKALGDFVNAFNSALGEQTKAAGNSEEAN